MEKGFKGAGRICRKSPPRTTVMPPKGLSQLFSFVNLSTSRRLLSRASKHFLFAIGASSHSISDVFINRSARSAAAPQDATASTIFPSDLSLVVIAFQRSEGLLKVQDPAWCMLYFLREGLPVGFP